MSLPLKWAIGTPRKLPKPSKLEGKVVVVDVAFAAAVGRGSFETVTLPFIVGLGDRLAAWVDHHDHERHRDYIDDPRFRLTTKAEHGACPELVDPELVKAAGPVDTIVCHNDFDGLASAAKWMLGGHEPYPGCDDDARAIDTRMGAPGPLGQLMDFALRGRPRDEALYEAILVFLYSGAKDYEARSRIQDAAEEFEGILKNTEILVKDYEIVKPGIAWVNTEGRGLNFDKTGLLLEGQKLAPVSVVVDRDTVSIAAAYDAGYDFVTLFEIEGGMPTRVSLQKKQLRFALARLGVDSDVRMRISKSCGQ